MKCRLWARKAGEEGETRVSDECGHTHPRLTHIYDDGDVPYGSLYLSTNSTVPRCLRVDQQQRPLMLARGSLATCFINVPMVDQNLSLPVIFLYDTYVLVLNSNYSVLAIGPPY